jgi:hypothetical protein
VEYGTILKKQNGGFGLTHGANLRQGWRFGEKGVMKRFLQAIEVWNRTILLSIMAILGRTLLRNISADKSPIIFMANEMDCMVCEFRLMDCILNDHNRSAVQTLLQIKVYPKLTFCDTHTCPWHLKY